MVGTIAPGKFYGSSLPRPRFYTDVKSNETRVDPPTDPLMSWAQEAHWSMGGLSFERRRLQGRIEGNVEKLRAHRESNSDQVTKTSSPVASKQGVVRKFGDAFGSDREIDGAATEGKLDKRKKY